MIPIDVLTAGRLSAAKAGDLFLPRDGAEGQRFLVGRLNRQYEVAAILEGDRPFHVAELGSWEGRRGLLISDYTILVDHTTCLRPSADGSESLGSLVLDGTNIGLVVESRSNTHHTLWLKGNEGERGSDSVIFTSWSIVAQGVGELWQELFSYGEGAEGWLESLSS